MKNQEQSSKPTVRDIFPDIKKQSQHTQGIWQLGFNPNKDRSIYSGIEMIIPRIKSDANAERIIKCVNMHDELVAHLKNLYSTCVKMSAISGVKMENKIIEEAIRQAEK